VTAAFIRACLDAELAGIAPPDVEVPPTVLLTWLLFTRARRREVGRA
jgi:hypothetical protein